MSSRIPRVPSRLLPALAALALCGASAALATAAYADELTMPQAGQASSQDHPRRGMSMQKVQALFGTPAKRIPAVGQPPISRWEYPGFVVYFENDRVLHSVIKG